MNFSLESLVAQAYRNGASDLHLEGGLPAAIRIRGVLNMTGEPIPAAVLFETAQELIGHEQWPYFEERRSMDLSRTISSVRCRINILHSARGVGLAVRLLSTFEASLDKLNLHPELRRLLKPANGLVLVSGPTGSGKSTTMAALIQEINLTETSHIVTLESPIEYNFRPRLAFIRQREIGRDTPSFEQGLLDALREDPNVLMVGEMRDQETMRLTLNAAETGHLVLATVHSATCAEALQRIVSAFPAGIQNNVAAQLADCLVGVVTQKLFYRSDLSIRIPECEILFPTNAIKAFIRNCDFFKIPQAMEIGADHGLWTFDRYRQWLAKKSKWYIPGPNEAVASGEPDKFAHAAVPPSKPIPSAPPDGHSTKSPPAKNKRAEPIQISPVAGGLEKVLKDLGC